MAGTFPEWLNVNAGRAFPLAENSSRLDKTGAVRLPDSLLVAAQINMTPDYRDGTFFIGEVTVTADIINLTVSFVTAVGEARNIAVIGVSVSAHRENRSYAFVGEGEDSSILGTLTIGNLVDTIREVPGRIEFSSSSTQFEVSALFVSVQALEAVELYNGDQLVKRFHKVLRLRAGENIRLSYVDNDPDVIRIDAISGENLVTPEDCGNAIPIPPCIRTINGVSADESGNFTLDGGDCIDVQVSTGIIELQDLCARSCCGCTELQSLVDGLLSVEQQIAQYRQQFNSVVTQQTQMIATLAANVK